MKIGRSSFLLALALCLLLPAPMAYGAETGSWAKSDDGKYWMYFYAPDEPAEDTWIEEYGKEYYVDSSGRMKTGWVTDKRDGRKYYMGEDGAKCFNMFTPDDHYVGDEGVALESFDTYRKAVKKSLNSLMKNKEYKGLEPQQLPGFTLMDLNGDDYRDLAVFDSSGNPGRLILAALWDPKEEKLQVSAEAEAKGRGETSGLTYNRETQTMWLKITEENGLDRDYFAMDDNGMHFENRWHFTVETDDWGDPSYYLNGDSLTEEEWNLAAEQADQESGERTESVLLPLTGDNIRQAVDCAPTEEEMPLWQL